MKSKIVLLLMAACSAVQLSAQINRDFPSGDPAGNHWRKNWPEGFDNGDDDAAVINAFSLPKDEPKAEEK